MLFFCFSLISLFPCVPILCKQDNTRIVQLNLTRNNLKGSLPRELMLLTDLVVLDVDHNKLTGSIPNEYAVLTDLRYLYGKHNQLTGQITPDLIRNMTQLEELQLSVNMIQGPLPTELNLLTKLRVLFLDYNPLSTTLPPLPTSLGTLPRWKCLVFEVTCFDSNPDLDSSSSIC